MFYKGINLNTNKSLDSWIKLQHSNDHELREVYMESDRHLQHLVKLHYLKITLSKVAFGIYAIVYSVIIYTQG